MKIVKGKGLDLNIIYDFACKEKGIDLRSYRSSFLLRRLRVRMDRCKVSSLEEYVGVLEHDRGEWDAFLEALSINVSEFFRDPEVFERFRDLCLGELIRRKREKSQTFIRLWSAGCSQGEETYSLAIIVKEILGDKHEFTVSIIGTDMDRKALEVASEGEYGRRSLRNVSDEIRKKYFLPVGDERWRVKEEIKKIVRFKEHNILKEPPIKYVDAIFFRNVRIYFSVSEADEILRKISESLYEDGYLVMGKVESLSMALRDYFVAVDNYCKIYQKRSKKGGSDGKSVGC